MVKVFSCHHFASQAVISTPSEVLTTDASGSTLFVAAADNTISVYDLSSDEGRATTTLSHFRTVATVKELYYNKIGGYVLTLEYRQSRKHLLTFVRAYFNWERSGPDQPVSVRLAGQRSTGDGPHNAQHSQGRWQQQRLRLEVLEIPQPNCAGCLASCPATGNIAVGTHHSVAIYRLCQGSTGGHQEVTKLPDFQHLFDLYFDFVVNEISLFENYIGCLATNEVLVASLALPNHLLCYSQRLSPKACKRKEKQGYKKELHLSDGSSFYSYQEDDFLVWDIEGSTSLCADEDLGSDLGVISNGKEKLSMEVKGVAPTVPGSTIKLSWPKRHDVNDPRSKVTTLLYKKFYEENTGDLHSLHLLPFLLSQLDSEGSSAAALAEDQAATDTLCDLCVFFTSSTVGYLYNVYGHLQLVSTYPYTARCRGVRVGHRLLHAITQAGLETYTLRRYASAIQRIDSSSKQSVKVDPPVDLDVCLLSLKSFMGLCQVVASQKSLVLTSKPNDSPVSAGGTGHGSSTLYLLRESEVSQLCADMVEQASLSKESNPSTYHHLLCEAHMLLQQGLGGAHHSQGGGQGIVGQEGQKMAELFRECSALLGDYYSRPNNQDYQRAPPYYLMSGATLAGVLARHHPQKYSGQGLVHYLDHQLFQEEGVAGQGIVNQGKPKAGDGVHRVLPQPLPSDHQLFQEREKGEEDRHVGNRVLRIYSQLRPQSLSRVLLTSALTSYNDSLALELLAEWREESGRSTPKNSSHPALDRLALAMLYLRLGDLEQARSEVGGVERTDLVQTCTDHYQLLLLRQATTTQLSDLAQLIGALDGGALIQVLTNLHHSGTVSLEGAVDMLGVSDGHLGVAATNRHLRDYLERLLSQSDRRASLDLERASFILVDIYLEKMQSSSTLPQFNNTGANHSWNLKPGGHFATRHLWLNNLPPFQGTSSLQRTCKWAVSAPSMLSAVAVAPVHLRSPPTATSFISLSANSDWCTCCCCNEDLLKLQALMCCEHFSPTLAHKVASAIAEWAVPGPRGSAGFSLKVLSLLVTDPDRATRQLLDSYPGILLEYAKPTFKGDREKWTQLTQLLLDHIRRSAMENNREYIAALKGLLEHTAELLDPLTFLGYLPDDGELRFFLPYIELCLLSKSKKSV